MINEKEVNRLLEAAGEAMKKAYVPYSQFQVGAALLDSQGNVHLGCNIENAAYGPTNCAERTAMFRAVADGHQPRSFQAMAVIADTKRPISPCGVCRQVMIELCGPHMPVFLTNLQGDLQQTTVAKLLPGAFNEEDLHERP
ncbi:cytidine deaminase [Paenibacillus turpanensis]|uniref:cytidine deaminase n=1 Tax=Paenibacillus turpanensis TaxID=2689078 RepID=UPI001409DF56|nr:cytidine deaminase [Paenibacillus turpanensis]